MTKTELQFELSHTALGVQPFDFDTDGAFIRFEEEANLTSAQRALLSNLLGRVDWVVTDKGISIPYQA